MASFSPEKFREKVGVTEDEYDAEVAACERESAEQHPSPEAPGATAGASAAVGAGTKVGEAPKGGGGGEGAGGSECGRMK
jgi:hypothetical protein